MIMSRDFVLVEMSPDNVEGLVASFSWQMWCDHQLLLPGGFYC